MKKEHIEEIKAYTKTHGLYLFMVVAFACFFGYSFDRVPAEFLYLKTTLISLIMLVFVLQKL